MIATGIIWIVVAVLFTLSHLFFAVLGGLINQGERASAILVMALGVLMALVAFALAIIA